MWGAVADSAGSTAPETATRPTNAMNHGVAWRAPTNNSAPNGDVSPQRPTLDEFSNPPRLHCRTKGSSKLIHSWLRRYKR